MKIEHIGIWVAELDSMIAFYQKYFGAAAGEIYHNPLKNFTSRFVIFPEGSRIEFMHNPEISKAGNQTGKQHLGYTHLAISLGTVKEVDRLTSILNIDGYKVLDGPRRTGDGYYESVVLDPEGNRIELTV